jgi:hypothetical protein
VHRHDPDFWTFVFPTHPRSLVNIEPFSHSSQTDPLPFTILVMASPIHLEGTTLEGGGQLVRLALSISALTGTPIRITNIRGNRSGGGGLKQQHLTALEWLSKACNARVEGALKKSRTLVFEPDVEVLEFISCRHIIKHTSLTSTPQIPLHSNSSFPSHPLLPPLQLKPQQLSTSAPPAP